SQILYDPLRRCLRCYSDRLRHNGQETDKESLPICFDRLTENVVRTRRIELPLPCGNRLLRPARLPVPPRPREFGRTLRILIRDSVFKGLDQEFGDRRLPMIKDAVELAADDDSKCANRP